MPGGVTKEVSQFKRSPSVPLPLFPSPYKLCHLSYFWSCTCRQRALRWPTISVKHERCSIQCSMCNTLRRVAELLEKRESAKPANVTGRFDAISVWPTEQVMVRGGRGVKKEGVARAGGWVRLSKRALSNYIVCRWHVAWKGNVGAGQ